MRWIRKFIDEFQGESRRFKGPVGWLLGRQLLAGLKFIAVYSLFGPKLDPKDWMSSEPIRLHEEQSDNGEFWFDYIADSGDGQKAVFNIGYLCLGDLWIRTADGQRRVELRESTGSSRLPRGRFLFVGGDTAYHISDFETLSERFRDPFNWAFESREANEGFAPERRPIYAIPANHDYYDAIDGFNRQFRKPVVSREDTDGGPQLDLDGFTREQSASYVAIKLPFDWWFWGLDAQAGAIDFRQREFFRNLSRSEGDGRPNSAHDGYQPPNKLIVATPEPSTAYRRWIDDQADLVRTFQSLGLECAFLKSNDGRLPETQCRLDISGDIHHYARYWGRDVGGDQGIRSRENYASVVAGGGGAFLHPTHTYGDGITESRLYPPISKSVPLFVSRLLNPWNIARGGYIWAVGGLLSLLLYFAGTIPDSTWSLVPIAPDAARPLSQPGIVSDHSILAAIQKDLSIPGLMAGTDATRFFPYVPDLAIAVLIIGLFLFCGYRLTRRRAERRFAAGDWNRMKGLLVAVGLLAVALVITLIFSTKEMNPHPLLASLLGILFITAGILAIIVTRFYTNLVFERSKSSASEARGDAAQGFSWRFWIENFMFREYLPSWVLMIGAFFSALFGLWRYGMYKAAVTFSDSVFIVILALAVIGLLVYAAGIGAAGLDRRARLTMLLVGLWHLVLQLGAAVLLVAYNDAPTTLTVLITVVAASVAMGRVVFVFMNRSPRFSDQKWVARILMLGWLVIGIGSLAVACSGNAAEVSATRMVGAFICGTVLSCVWFGWYLAVASTYRAHYNEAGGGARTARYRHMVRFKLEPDQLTGYVIGIDRPVADFDPNNLPTFELVDEFSVSLRKK